MSKINLTENALDLWTDAELRKVLRVFLELVIENKELFSFHSEQDWINKAQSRYSTCGVRKGMYITVDANGHILHMGKCFAEATKSNAYPVRVYELKTNWTSP